MEPYKQIPLDLSIVSKKVVEVFLLDNSTEPSLLNEIVQSNTHRPELIEYLRNHPLTPEDTRQLAADTLKLPVPISKGGKELERVDEQEDEPLKQRKTQRLLHTIQGLKMGEKMQLALRGSHEIRSILLRDPNQEIMIAVLNNPKITDSEIELLSKQKSTSVEVIREIVKKKAWIKNYQIVQALVSNSKTPIGVALKYIHFLRLKELRRLEKNKNVPEAVRANAKKLIEARKG